MNINIFILKWKVVKNILVSRKNWLELRLKFILWRLEEILRNNFKPEEFCRMSLESRTNHSFQGHLQYLWWWLCSQLLIKMTSTESPYMKCDIIMTVKFASWQLKVALTPRISHAALPTSTYFQYFRALACLPKSFFCIFLALSPSFSCFAFHLKH